MEKLRQPAQLWLMMAVVTALSKHKKTAPTLCLSRITDEELLLHEVML
jgi:hypothetical protein